MIRRSFRKHVPTCAAEGCSVIVGQGKIFCPDHYYSLPPELRKALWKAWGAAMDARKGRTLLEDQMRINREYQAAYQACWNYLLRAPRTPQQSMSTVAIAADGARDYAAKRITGGAPNEFRYVYGRRL